ncbi:hypothetical protein ACGFNU_11590 [Spirillospora sp. NPDC048911]|uniref:hypothetical protein n=1 Tax=Spirillospora sp. NPDC048911 TaxID=3364527 RepID=UPI00371D7718
MAVPAGYSGTPLPRKLGIKPEHRVLMAGTPDGFELGPLPPGVVLHRRPSGREPYDVILAFCPDLATLKRRFGASRARLETAGGLWIAWPKKSSGVATDLSDDIVREYGLATGMVDNKVCAVDQTWSGQRFVVRLADR